MASAADHLTQVLSGQSDHEEHENLDSPDEVVADTDHQLPDLHEKERHNFSADKELGDFLDFVL